MSASDEKATKREQFLKEMKQHMERASKMTPEELKFQYRGITYPSVLCSEESFQAMEAVEAREDDVLIATYPKCGTNWTIQILHEMLFTLNNKEPTLTQAMLEFGTPGKFKELSQAESPRVISSHLAYDNLPKSFFEKKTKSRLGNASLGCLYSQMEEALPKPCYLVTCDITGRVVRMFPNS